VEVLVQLKFAKSIDDCSNNYSIHCTRLWEVLEGEQRGGILTDNLKLFTAAIMKILLSSELPECNSDHYGSFIQNGTFLFTQDQATRIHKNFCVFYLNRTAYNLPKPKALREDECTFKPSLCEHSVSLANTTRSAFKISTTEHIDLLIQSKEKKEQYKFLMNNRKLRKRKVECEKYKSSQCTFKPQINKAEFSRSLSNPRITTKKNDRCDELYKLAKKLVKKEDTKTDDYVYMKEPEEYTFAPKLSKMKAITPTAFNDPLTLDTIQRLKKGREEYERVKRMTERGIIPREYDTNPRQSPPERSKELEEKIVEPKEKLYIDVNMGESTERIIVHKGDTATSLAKEFAERHSKNKGLL
jgi:hypothetical protein